ncbi:hypothetical protein [Wenzhouxiangella sediminis]|uniref:Uncharacterized protein n=1 Tax=Wenzhouxiangella sediminis TaxID=1792836 RepID=A0A3E1KB43_9GAMM|nr:hypothetical protein [Wenzhouxiangella sediminis]RFF31737.1 hypothetical protein DZC52_03570 [Wenzhouxiangella sediminis]
MARSLKPLFIVAILSSFSLVAAVQGSDQRTFRVPDESIGIDDLGLEHRVRSATQLVGSGEESGNQYRAELIHRLQCWIDGLEHCSPADLNDSRVREIRSFLGTGPKDRDGAVVIRFPDETRIQVRLQRVPEPDPQDWDRKTYEAIIVEEAGEAP